MSGVQAQALVCTDANELSIQDVRLPEIEESDILVRTAYSGVSVGTEFSVISGRLDWGPYPLVTGYQGVGVVEEAGNAVNGFARGDTVYFRDNTRMSTVDGESLNAAAGVHCSRAVINVEETHGVALLPDGADRSAASLFVLPAVGLHGTDMGQVTVGERVLVMGTGLVGLGVVAACSRRGADVTAVDMDQTRLDVARTLGAVRTARVETEVQRVVDELVADAPFDVVFEASGLHDLVDPAISACRSNGRFVWQGNYGEGPVAFTFLLAHMRQIHMVFPCDDGQEPSRAAVVRAIADGTLPWQATVTHEVSPAEAPDLYARIRSGSVSGLIGAVIDWGASR